MRHHNAPFRREKRGTGHGQQRAGDDIQQEYRGTIIYTRSLPARGRKIAEQPVAGENAYQAYGDKKQHGR